MTIDWNKGTTYLYIITLISILYTAWCEYDINKFYDSYNFYPLTENISISNETQNYSFDIEYVGTYSVGVYYHKIINIDTLSLAVRDDFTFKWEVRDSLSQIVPNKKQRATSGSSKYLGNIIGNVNFSFPGQYSITITPNKTDDILNSTNPQIMIKCIDAYFWDYTYRIIQPFILSTILIIISIISFLIKLIYNRINKNRN